MKSSGRFENCSLQLSLAKKPTKSNLKCQFETADRPEKSVWKSNAIEVGLTSKTAFPSHTTYPARQLMDHPPADSTDKPRFRPLRIFTSGLCMGAADIVPGVSGGTIALILGVYERLLTAITRFDSKLLTFVKKQAWGTAAQHVDLRFLSILGAGILTGILGLAGLMDYLLTHQRSMTFAAFFGLILASGFLVGRLVRPKSGAQSIICVVFGIVAAIGAFSLMTLGHMNSTAGIPYTFLCGMVGICAMILPGVSGAYLLLMLGKYEEITGILKSLPKLQVTGADLVTVAVFCMGCLVGLLLFSRFLRWQLRRHWSETMAVLCGFMIGSLYRVWPLQVDTTPEIEKFKQKIFQPYWPETWSTEVTACLVIAIVSFFGVLAMDRLSKNLENGSEATQESRTV